ncbi:InlB B-repeat-containing protein, partial [Bifidobacterium callitrichos]
ANSNVDFGAADLTLYGFGDYGDKNWTVTYDFKYGSVYGAKYTVDDVDGNAGNGAQVNVAEGSTIVEPNDPAYWNAEFTGWYDKNNAKVDFNTPVQNIPGADPSTRTLTVHAGWDQDNIKQVTYYYGYYVAGWNNPSFDLKNIKKHTGVAVDFVTGDSKINAPTGVEDYFQTQADQAHNTYTSRTVSAWVSTKDGAPISTVKAKTSVYALWDGAAAVKLNGNGGQFSNGELYAYATKTDGQKWQDVVVTPTRSGFDFAGWYKNDVNVPGNKANLYDGIYADGTKIGENDELIAKWTPSEQLDNAAALSAWPLIGAVEPDWKPDFKNIKADYKLAEKYA